MTIKRTHHKENAMASTDWKPRFRHATLASLLGSTLLLAAHGAAACPPGYVDKAGHCLPAPPTTPAPTAASQTRTVPIHPAGPVPVEAASASGSNRGIIFVGGKNAINSQPVPPGKPIATKSPDAWRKAALNPQPIPPGRDVRKPRPGSPVETTIGH